jgi:hypothetical protein
LLFNHKRQKKAFSRVSSAVTMSLLDQSERRIVMQQTGSRRSRSTGSNSVQTPKQFMIRMYKRRKLRK